MQEEMNLTFRGIVISGPSKKLTKSSGAIYVLQRVKILDGPLKDMVVSGERTLLNRDKVEKEPFEIDDKCVIYPKRVENYNEPGKYVTLFTLGEEMGASQDEINERLEAFFEMQRNGVVNDADDVF